MGTLYLVRIQPNPPGRDAISPGKATAQQLNNEWVEFGLSGDARSLKDDKLFHNTYSSTGCNFLNLKELVTFSEGNLTPGYTVRVHTGVGTSYTDGTVHHIFLNLSWFVWNNSCGDRATLSYNGTTIDWAQYQPGPREGILVRQSGTNWFR